MMFEHKRQPVLPLPQFLGRVARSLLLAGIIIAIALGIGIIGYHVFAQLTWIDSLLNASMILTGMGPVATLSTSGAKIFASTYALFSGVVFLSSVALILSPLFHRFLHRFHFEEEDDEPRSDAGPKRPIQ